MAGSASSRLHPEAALTARACGTRCRPAGLVHLTTGGCQDPGGRESRVRELALFNLGIDSKLRGCDLVALRVRDVCHGDQVASRAIVMQHKTQRPVQFEITQATRDALQAWTKQAALKPEDFLFPSRLHDSPHLGTRQYARI
jgi:site-specific recombinase XerC